MESGATQIMYLSWARRVATQLMPRALIGFKYAPIGKVDWIELMIENWYKERELIVHDCCSLRWRQLIDRMATKCMICC